MRILVVEDDDCIAKALETILGNQHYVVDVAKDGLLGWEFVEAFIYDLILLDVILPELDGIEFCQKLRSHNYQMPVLLLTAQNSSIDKVVGLDAGADDYMVKPFEVTELLARIRVLLRRKNTPIQAVLEWENLCLNPGSTEVTYNNHLINLTPKEYRLLELFLRNSNIVFSRSDILDHLWPMEEAPKEDTITAHIKGLRQKLTRAGAPSDLIETVYGLGYRLKEVANTKVEPSEDKPQKKRNNKQSKKQQQTKEALTQVWQGFKLQSIERIAVLEQTVNALLENTINEELREKAQTVAHQLAGGLGIFGFSEGSRLAGEIEQVFKSGVNLGRNQGIYLRKSIKLLQREIKQPAFKSDGELVQYDKSSVMVIVDDDEKLASSIVKSAVASGIHIELVENLLVAEEALIKTKADVVLFSVSLAKTSEDSLSKLATLTNSIPPVPVIICTNNDSLANRVKLSRLFAHVFLQKPLRTEHLLEVISKVLTQSRSQTGKVMVVDDDPQMLGFLRDLLLPCGLKLSTLNEPLWFWDILATNSPDLLILDIEMPHINGIELCQVVRNEPRWSGLPIVFLTVHNDVETIQKAFNAGASECLNKSIVGLELVNHIFNHLERVKLFQTINAVAN